jgi:DNA-binding transcriptional ArsR family regulator
MSLNIQQRSADAVALFLANPAPVAALSAPLKGINPAKETVPAGKLPKAGKINKAAKALKPVAQKAKEGRPGMRGEVLAAIRGGADTLDKISKIVKRAINTVGYHVSALVDAGLVTKTGGTGGVTIKPAGKAPAAAPQPSIKEIHCNARQRKIMSTECVFNDASPVCRACVVRPKG